MPLHILLILVVGGIAGVALALHFLGLSKTKALDLNTVRSEWLRHYPDDTFDDEDSIDVLVSLDASRGLLRSDQGYGLVWTMGTDTSARRLGTSSWRETRSGVTFTFDDPSAPWITIQLQDSERHLWLSYLRKFHGP
ncbi:hypothetical protein GCM10007385_37160 [Tateyamaria omphalii]|uniref:hypothetical protein n=1 Tax=Tateyamaria omphalii TaxID=299262 RepID=UPI001676A9EF|nr:hypothetical protein [Tateyamaria omphalii]GGX64638.1 hypothetical protein GCM10007385_37160 [Tateyamaria omphalii]